MLQKVKFYNLEEIENAIIDVYIGIDENIL